MCDVPFRGQRREEDRTGTQGNFQAQNFYRERQQSHYGIPDNVDRERRHPDRSSCRGPKLERNRDYFRTASLNAFDGRRRTTVFALILIASPVCGLRPMRALRCAFTTRPIPGITNLPAAPLASFTASLNSSSKKRAAVFFAVPTFSAMCPTTLVLLSGLAAI